MLIRESAATELAIAEERGDAPGIPGPMRTGRSLGRTLYIVAPGDDRKADRFLGVITADDDAEARGFAKAIVTAVNGFYGYEAE
jgi:hypothetical protein